MLKTMLKMLMPKDALSKHKRNIKLIKREKRIDRILRYMDKHDCGLFYNKDGHDYYVTEDGVRVYNTATMEKLGFLSWQQVNEAMLTEMEKCIKI